MLKSCRFLNEKTFFFVLVILLIIIFFHGCRKQKSHIFENDNANLTTIVIPNVVESSDIVIIDNDLKYIILEEKENSFFGHVSKLRVYKNKIYVFDRRYAQAIFIFTIEGKHLASIGINKGQGPLEFISIHNFEIDYFNDQLLIMDNFGFKFMVYDLEGNFIKRIDSNIPVTQAVLLPDWHIVHAKNSNSYMKTGQSDCCIIITDDKKQVVKEGFRYYDNKDLDVISFGVFYTLMDGGINFAPRFKDTIYNVSFEEISPKYAIDFGNNKRISKSVIDKLSSSIDLFKLMSDGNLCFIGDHVESDDFLYLKLSDVAVFFNKKTNNTIAISNKFKGKGRWAEHELYEILCSDSEGYFYGAFNLAPIDELIKLFPEMDELDKNRDLNPVLFRYKIKK